MRTAHWISLALLIIGGLNWGIIGLSNENLVNMIFGQLDRVIYVIVGLAALYELYFAATTNRDVVLAPPR